MGNALDNLRHLIDSYGWRDNRDLQDFIDAADMIGMQYVELPKDADGEYIRIGDLIAYEDNTKPKEVVALVPPSVVMVDDGPRYADLCRHYHAQTVEDVLLELLDEAEHFHSLEEEREAIAEYAAKLQLAGDAAGPNEMALAYHVGYDDALAKRKPNASKVMQR